MKINGNAIRPGMVIEHRGGLWRAVKTQHVKPGKGPAYLQVELKHVLDGTKLNESFRAAERVLRARLEQRNYQYLFEADGAYTFMNIESYEQVELSGQVLGGQAAFLQDGMEVVIEFHEDRALGVRLPDSVTLAVSETEAVVKGQTAASSSKPALLENGLRVMVPPFVNVGDQIVVNTIDATYVKRAD
jgi:elongation factor P